MSTADYAFQALMPYSVRRTVRPMDTFAKRLAKAIDYANLTQQEVADRSGVQQKTISKLVTGQQKESTKIVQLAYACGVNPYWLATGKGPMEAEKKSVVSLDVDIPQSVKLTDSKPNNVLLAVLCITVVRRYLEDSGRQDVPEGKMYALAEVIFDMVKKADNKQKAFTEAKRWLELAFI